MRRLLSTTSKFEAVAGNPHITQAPEHIDRAAKAAVLAYDTPGEKVHVASWSEYTGSVRGSDTPRSTTSRPGVASRRPSGTLESLPAPGVSDGRSDDATGLGMFTLPKARPSRSQGSMASVNRSPRTVLPPLLPGPPTVMAAQPTVLSLGTEMDGFGSAMHLAHVTRLSLEFGEKGGNNVRIPLDVRSDDESLADDSVSSTNSVATSSIDTQSWGRAGGAVPTGNARQAVGNIASSTHSQAARQQAKGTGGAAKNAKKGGKSRS